MTSESGLAVGLAVVVLGFLAKACMAWRRGGLTRTGLKDRQAADRARLAKLAALETRVTGRGKVARKPGFGRR